MAASGPGEAAQRADRDPADVRGRGGATAVLVTVVTTAGSVRSAVARGYPGLAGALRAVNVNLIIDYVGVSIGIVAWLVLTWALVRRRARARIALAAYLGSMTLSLLIGVGQDSARYAPADLIAGAVCWLIALVTCVLLFTGTAGRFYYPQPRVVTPWRGTFGGR